MSDNVFVKRGTFDSLKDFAKFAFKLLECEKLEEHESANYWGGLYFLGRLDHATLTIALADEVGFEEYDYWLSVGIDSQKAEGESALGQKVARRLAQCGLEAARPFSKEDWLYSKFTFRRIVYRKTLQTANGQIEEEVEEVSRS